MRQFYDLLGIGAGVFNLSLAALLEDKKINSHFLDKKPSFEWYPGLMLDSAKMQTCCIKDLVSLAEPTNQYSFLNYLRINNRLFQFLNKGSFIITRKEFFAYVQWVSKNLPNISRGVSVENVLYKNDTFEVNTSAQTYYAKNISISVGRDKFLPDNTKSLLSDKVFHGLDYLFKKNKVIDSKRIILIGGGQTSAEIFIDIMDDFPKVEEIIWISRRSNFLPLDNSPFIDDLYIPSYVNYFSSLDDKTKRKKHNEQRLTSDGVSLSTLNELYEKIYDNNFIRQEPRINITLKPFREFNKIRKTHNGYEVEYTNLDTKEVLRAESDIVIFATGLEIKVPSFLKGISHLLDLNDTDPRLVVGKNFEVSWQYGHQNSIYVQNMSRFSHGPWESNISLAAWRSAMIINHLTDGVVFPRVDRSDNPFVSWSDASEERYLSLLPPTQGKPCHELT